MPSLQCDWRKFRTPQPNWNAGLSGTVSFGVAIPDDDVAGVDLTFTVSGGVNYRLLRIDIDLQYHPSTDQRPWSGNADLALGHRQYAGESTGISGSSQADINFVLDSTQFWGEKDAVGTWTLNVSDRAEMSAPLTVTVGVSTMNLR